MGCRPAPGSTVTMIALAAAGVAGGAAPATAGLPAMAAAAASRAATLRRPRPLRWASDPVKLRVSEKKRGGLGDWAPAFQSLDLPRSTLSPDSTPAAAPRLWRRSQRYAFPLGGTRRPAAWRSRRRGGESDGTEAILVDEVRARGVQHRRPRARRRVELGRGAQLPGPQPAARRGQGRRRRPLLRLERRAVGRHRHRRGGARRLPGPVRLPARPQVLRPPERPAAADLVFGGHPLRREVPADH